MQQPARTDRVFPVPVVWAFVPVYFVHLLDERFWGVGTANWSSAHTPFFFDNTVWLWVNVPSFLLMAAVVLGTLRRILPEWAVVAMALHVLLHAAMRIFGSLVFASVAPGVVTSVLLCVPLGGWCLVRGARELPRSELKAGLIAGVMSLQALWHAVVYPFLPGHLS